MLNDVAIAIRDLHAIHPERRIFVIDTDAHQGNGSNGIFADDERVFTYSIHVGRNYPAEKTAGSFDVELPRFVSGEQYLERLNATLPAAFERFAPDLAFWIAGSDPHENDRFGQMKLSDVDMAARDRAVLDLVTKLRVPTVALDGGGYNRDRVHSARLHANTVKLADSFWRWNAGAAQIERGQVLRFDVPAVLRLLRARRHPHAAVVYPWLFTPDFFARKENVETAFQRAMAYPHQTKPEAIERQAKGIAAWNGTRVKRLSTLRVPTLVMVGKDDILTPPAFSKALARQIPRAKLAVLPGGHGFFLEHADLFNRALVRFLVRPREVRPIST